MTVATALLPLGIVWVLIRYLHSRSRNELWTLRDSLVDDLLAGRIASSRGAHRLLHLVETHIRVAGRHTLGDLLLALAVLRDEENPLPSDELFRDGATATDRQVLDRYLERLWSINFRYLVSSSPIGWALYAVGWVRSRMVRLRKRKAAMGRPAESIWRELDQQPTFRHARDLELGKMSNLIPSRAYRRERNPGPILPHLLSRSG